MLLCAKLTARNRSYFPVLISGRIMWSNYKVKRYRAGYAALTYWGVIETIVQSAAIYSAALISLLTTSSPSPTRSTSAATLSTHACPSYD